MAIKLNHKTDTISTSNSAKVLKLKDAQGLQLPSGFTAERPVAEEGTVRYNKDESYLELFGANQWQSLRPKVNIHRYSFTHSMYWLVQHNMNTTRFSETLLTESGRRIYAAINVIDLNSFEVLLTEETTGYVDVIFDQTNENIIYAN